MRDREGLSVMSVNALILCAVCFLFLRRWMSEKINRNEVISVQLLKWTVKCFKMLEMLNRMVLVSCVLAEFLTWLLYMYCLGEYFSSQFYLNAFLTRKVAGPIFLCDKTRRDEIRLHKSMAHQSLLFFFLNLS